MGRGFGHRSGGIEFKRLLQGTPAQPDNFELSIVRTAGDYFTPRHRHNFDQVRSVSEGANELCARQGPEGRHRPAIFPRAPSTARNPTPSKSGGLLVLQMGGSAGYGFMSYQQLTAGYEKLADLGQFDGGVFTRSTTDGRVRSQTATRRFGSTLTVAPSNIRRRRYDENRIVIHPEGFGWLATRDSRLRVEAHGAPSASRAVNT